MWIAIVSFGICGLIGGLIGGRIARNNHIARQAEWDVYVETRRVNTERLERKLAALATPKKQP